jgi:hypothetical protein
MVVKDIAQPQSQDLPWPQAFEYRKAEYQPFSDFENR